MRRASGKSSISTYRCVNAEIGVRRLPSLHHQSFEITPGQLASTTSIQNTVKGMT